MPRVHVYDIEWDTEDAAMEEDGVAAPELPTEVEIDLDPDYDPDYEPAETLSRLFGFCVKGFNFEEIQ